LPCVISPLFRPACCPTPVLFNGFTAVVATTFRVTQNVKIFGLDIHDFDDLKRGAAPTGVECRMPLSVAGLNQGSDLIVITA
jgi:hypothetical protein